MILLWLATLAAAQNATGNATCAACDGPNCVITESIKVGSMCADQLCVNNRIVVGGDGNPCTHEERDSATGQLVSVTLDNCCRVDSDCAQFRPNPVACFTSVCTRATTGAVRGHCTHTEKSGCCTCDADCKPMACMTATCDCRTPGQTILTAEFAFVKHATTEDRVCTYTQIQNCCLRSTSTDAGDTFACNNMPICNTHETAICDKACQCICLKEIEHDCETDADCNAPDNSTAATMPRARNTGRPFGGPREEPKRRHPRSADRCAHLVCSPSHLCVPDKNDEFDGDGDGVPCRRDCDDTNANVTSFAYCAREGVPGDVRKFNRDNDSCVACGAPVDRFCANNCTAFVANSTFPNGTANPVPIRYIQVNESSVCERNGAKVVCFDCDCCDANPGGCDAPGFCGRDADRDGIPFCPVQAACLLAENRTRHTDDDSSESSESHRSRRSRRGSRFDSSDDSEPTFDFAAPVNDSRCVQWATVNGIEDPDEFIVVEPGQVTPDTQFCETCETRPGQELGTLTCHIDTDGDGRTDLSCPGATSLQTCCDQIDNAPNAPQAVKDCCNTVVGNNCTMGKLPITFNQCECGPDLIVGDEPDECPEDPTGFFQHDCYADFDGDGLADCSKKTTICSRIEDPEEACADAGAIFIEDPVGSPPFTTNDQCDCNDKDPHSSQWVACLADRDNDGFSTCNCTLRCGECGKGFVPANVTQHTPSPPWGGKDRKRALSDTKDLLANYPAARGGEWKHEKGGKWDGTTKTTTSTKTRRPKHHEKCPSQQVIDKTCTPDCCDSDLFAFPGSTFASENPIKCPPTAGRPSHDYNCDGINDHFGGCGKQVQTANTGSRNIRKSTNNDVHHIDTSGNEWLGTCHETGSPCTLHFGASPEAPNGVRLQKRAEPDDIALECVSADNVVITGTGATLNVFSAWLSYGKCTAFIAACTGDTDSECHEDSDRCVVIGQ